MRVCSAERVHLSGCSYHSARMCAALSRCTSAAVLTIWHVCVCSDQRVHFSGCSYHMACVCAMPRGCTSAGGSAERVYFSACSYHSARMCAAQSGCTVLTTWHVCVCIDQRVHFSGCSYHMACVCVQCRAGALELLRLSSGVRVCVCVCSAERVLLRGCSYHVGEGKNHFDLRVGKYPVPFSRALVGDLDKGVYF